MPAIADAGEGGDALFDEVGRRPHVDDFRRPGIPDGPGAAHAEQRVTVDLERGVVDAGVVVLRPVEYHHRPFEGIRIRRGC